MGMWDLAPKWKGSKQEPLGDSRPHFYRAQQAREKRRENERYIEECLRVADEKLNPTHKPVTQEVLKEEVIKLTKVSLLKRFFRWYKQTYLEKPSGPDKTT